MKEKYHVPSHNLQIMQHKTSKKASRVLTFETYLLLFLLSSSAVASGGTSIYNLRRKHSFFASCAPSVLRRQAGTETSIE